MDPKEKSPVSIWFFIGALLAACGILIFGYALYAASQPVQHRFALEEFHADKLWSLLLLVIGLILLVKFWPWQIDDRSDGMDAPKNPTATDRKSRP